jgi:hypothetical protein
LQLANGGIGELQLSSAQNDRFRWAMMMDVGKTAFLDELPDDQGRE